MMDHNYVKIKSQNISNMDLSDYMKTTIDERTNHAL